MSEPKTRHFWSERTHSRDHVRTCLKCGCEKDMTVMNITIYWLNGEKHYESPSCLPKKN